MQQVPVKIGGRTQARHQYDNCVWPQECGPDRQVAGQLGLARHPRGPWDIG